MILQKIIFYLKFTAKNDIIIIEENRFAFTDYLKKRFAEMRIWRYLFR